MLALPADLKEYDYQHRVTTQRGDIKLGQARIKALQEERLAIQKKNYTNWVNSILLKVWNFVFAFPLVCVQSE
jgi:hypothetical protein